MMNRAIAFLVVISLLAGCCWVARDYTYNPVNENGWRCEFTSGEQKSVKYAPTADKALLLFDKGLMGTAVYAQ